MSANINILGVDDQPENLLALEAILDDLNVTFLSATSGSQALDCLLQDEIALILMDVMMPEMDGYETAELIRGSQRTRQIPIIFISAVNTEKENLFRGYTTGAVDYLAKPIVPEILRSKVTVFLELYNQRKSLQDKALQLQIANAHISKQQEALRVSEVRFRSAFEQSFQFMAILDSKGRVLELNNLALKFRDDSQREPRGRYLWEICWIGEKGENQRLREAIEQASRGINTSDEATFTNKNGEVRYFFRAVSPVINGNGEIACITVQGHDITERVNAEREKRELEQLLYHSQKMEALGILAGGIAHDFNNVLSVIVGNGDLLQRNLVDRPEDAAFLHRINAAASKAKDLAGQILSFSRQSEIEKTLVYPAEVVMEGVRLLRSSLPSTIEIIHDVNYSSGSILADSTQYHQVLMNLCTNAFHAMEEKGGCLSITLKRKKLDQTFFFKGEEMSSGKYICLTVSDNGHGIEQDCLNRIFDPYFTTKVEGRGTGMGLSIVHGIVKNHGGIIRVDSAVGEGTTFQVFIPLAEEKSITQRSLSGKVCYGSEQILLVDDEELLLEMVQNMLHHVGYQVTVMSSSTEAFRRFCDDPHQFDLVLTDQTMPEMVGTELAKKIHVIRPEIPIVLCTGYGPNISGEDMAAAGIEHMLRKPFAMEELTSVVRNSIDGKLLNRNI